MIYKLILYLYSVLISKLIIVETNTEANVERRCIALQKPINSLTLYVATLRTLHHIYVSIRKLDETYARYVYVKMCNTCS